MRRTGCERETDVLDAVASERWPDRLDAGLSAHVASCSICQDLGLVAASFAASHEHGLQHAKVPSPGLVWWRAQIRARRDATESANRPITFVQAVAGVSGLVAISAALSQVDISSIAASGRTLWEQLFIGQPLGLYLSWFVFAILLILTPLALYLVWSDD